MISNALKIVVCTFALTSVLVMAQSAEELKQKFTQMIVECSREFPLTSDDIEQLKAGKFPDRETVKCLFGCVYKKTGLQIWTPFDLSFLAMTPCPRSWVNWSIDRALPPTLLPQQLTPGSPTYSQEDNNPPLDDQGQLSAEGVRNVSEKYFSDDPDMIKKSEEFTQACITVNDVAVSDGDKGCERAALIFKCSVEKAPEFGLV